jgi:DNA-binding transcriptional regulator GbsR (MarR family)
MTTMDASSQTFIEQMGLTSERHGMPRIAGRLLGFLLLDGGAHSLDDLAERLQVSKASVSTNARVLENLQLIERQTVPGDRRDFYRIGDNPGEHMFELARQRLEETRRLFDTTRHTLPEEMEEARARVTAWSSFYAFLLDDLDRKVERWRDQLRDQPSA